MALFIPPAIETIEAVSGALLGAATVIYEASGHPSGHQTTITDHFPKSSKKHKSSVWEPKYTRTMPGVKRYATGRRKNPAVFNLQASKTSMVSNDNNGDEVQVVNPPRHVAQVTPDYFTIKHTLYNYQIFTGTADTIERASFKMNGLNNPVLSQITPNIQQPMGTDIRQTEFNYYRVLKAFIKFTYISECPNTQVCGFEVNDSTGSYLTGSAARAFAESKQTHHAIVPKHEDGNGPRTVVFTYEFDPNRDHHVTETGIDTRWTAKTSDPTSIHNIHFTAAVANGGSLNWTSFHNELITEIIYLTQWREAVTTIWGTPDADI